MSKPSTSRPRTVLFTAALILSNLLVGVGIYLGSIVWRSAAHYRQHRRWIGNAYRVDAKYGFFPNPNRLAYHSLQHGEVVPVLFDENGFRIPSGEQPPEGTSGFRILFLGDSFTHGYGVPAEKTFSYLTARELHASALNAGGSGWGLAQMVLRARDVIPRLRPQVVIVQYSRWLAARSSGFYGPTDWAKAPVPYFYESDGTIDIHEPVFESAALKVPVPEYAGKDLLPFVWHVGIPLLVHDDYCVLRTFLRSRLRLLPSPTASRQRVVDYAYGEIQRACAANGATMLVLVLHGDIDQEPEDRLEAFGCPVVDTLPALRRQLPEPTHESWAASYYFWRGDPPRIVDRHPNARMHAAVAEVLAETLRALPQPIATVGGTPGASRRASR